MRPSRGYVYRAFDGAGMLLYIGASIRINGRLADHQAGAGWWSEVASITVAHFPSRAQAFRAEMEAIRCERPRYNVQCNGNASVVAGPSAGPVDLHELRDVSETLRQSKIELEERRVERLAIIRQAVAEGMPATEIADALGVTCGRISQITRASLGRR